jgi:hypothetical protein
MKKITISEIKSKAANWIVKKMGFASLIEVPVQHIEHAQYHYQLIDATISYDPQEIPPLEYVNRHLAELLVVYLKPYMRVKENYVDDERCGRRIEYHAEIYVRTEPK